VMDCFRNFVILRLDFVGTDNIRDVGGEEVQFVIQQLKCVLIFPVSKQYDIDIKTSDIFGTAFLERLVANPSDMELFAQPDPDIMKEYSLQREFAEKVNTAYARAPVVKVIVTRPGIQKISYEELKKSGISAEKLSLKNLKLFFQNREIPVFLERGESKYESFSSGDSLYFYAPDPRNNNHSYEVYWLIIDDEKSPPPLTIELIQQRPQEKTPIIENGWYERKMYPPKNYHHFISMPFVSSRWYWENIKQGEFKEYPIYLYGIDQQSEDCTLTIKIGTVERGKTNLCKIYINEKPFETLEWFGWKTNIWSKNIPPSYLQEGLNKIAIEIPDSRDEKYNSELCLYGFEFKYKGLLQTEEDCMSFTIKSDTEPALSQIQFKIGSATLPVYVFNVTNPEKPYMLQPFFTGIGHRR
ncbi:MAG: hypothetical protein N2246_11020, partial [Candidatus Sumerlaeia bacterium]|nr:hypothetical protein [Candidatus Sumerlaeia bacterium]